MSLCTTRRCLCAADRNKVRAKAKEKKKKKRNTPKYCKCFCYFIYSCNQVKCLDLRCTVQGRMRSDLEWQCSDQCEAKKSPLGSILPIQRLQERLSQGLQCCVCCRLFRRLQQVRCVLKEQLFQQILLHHQTQCLYCCLFLQVRSDDSKTIVEGNKLSTIR